MARRWSFWMTPLEHGFIRWLDDRYRGLLTAPGRVLLWAAALSTLLLSRGFAPPLVAGFSFCASALLAAAFVGRPFRPRLRLRRRLPASAMAGEVITYPVVVENVGRRVARHVFVQERDLPAELRPVGEPPLVERLLPGESVEVVLRLSCRERGTYLLDRLQGASAFPSGLFKWGRMNRDEDSLYVHPRPVRIEHLELPPGRPQPGGIVHQTAHTAEAPELAGTREWRQGDRLRDVHWAAYARTGRLVVREWQDERLVRVALVVDVEARGARQAKAFERALGVSAGLVDALERQGCVVDVVVAGREVFRLGEGTTGARADDALDVLAGLESRRRVDFAAVQAAVEEEAHRLSAVVFVTTAWDEARASVVRRARERGAAVRVVAASSGEVIEP